MMKRLLRHCHNIILLLADVCVCVVCVPKSLNVLPSSQLIFLKQSFSVGVSLTLPIIPSFSSPFLLFSALLFSLLSAAFRLLSLHSAPQALFSVIEHNVHSWPCEAFHELIRLNASALLTTCEVRWLVSGL